MRRLLAVLLILGPGARRSRRAVSDDDGAASGTASTPTAAAPTSGLKTPGELSVASDIPYAPFEFTEPGSTEAIGFDVDLVKAIAADAGHHRRPFVKTRLRLHHPAASAGPLRHVRVLVHDHAGAREADRLRRPLLQRPTSASWSRPTPTSPASTTSRARRSAPSAARPAPTWPRPSPGRDGPAYDTHRRRLQRARPGPRGRASINDFPVSAYAAAQKPHAQGRGRGARQPRAYGLVFPKDNPALRDAFNTGLAEIKAERHLRRDLRDSGSARRRPPAVPGRRRPPAGGAAPWTRSSTSTSTGTGAALPGRSGARLLGHAPDRLPRGAHRPVARAWCWR